MANEIFAREFSQGSLVVFDNKPDLDFHFVKQVHGNQVLSSFDTTSEADGMIGDYNTKLAIITADCLPILFLGEKNYAFIHAGWKGLQQKIIGNSNIKKIKPLHIFIGPSIQANSFEVQEDFKLHFPHAKLILKKQKLFFNLQEEALLQISQNYPNTQVEVSSIDTFTSAQFHSYRRNKTVLRNWNVFLPGLS